MADRGLMFVRGGSCVYFEVKSVVKEVLCNLLMEVYLCQMNASFV